MPALLNKPTHREQQPPRRCKSCGAWLRSYNESTTCDPCGVPSYEIVDGIDGDILTLIASAQGQHNRRKAFQAAEELEALISEAP